MQDRKDVTDSHVTAYLDNCRILMTSVKVRGVRRYCWTGRDSYVTAYLDNCRILMTSVKVRGGRRKSRPINKEIVSRVVYFVSL